MLRKVNDDKMSKSKHNITYNIMLPWKRLVLKGLY